MRRITRRHALGLALAGFSVLSRPALAGLPSRIVPIDWGLAETLLALGVEPAGLPETRGYRAWVSVPPLPEGTPDLGLRTAPNLDYLVALSPDMILITPQFSAIETTLARIAPVRNLAIYTTELTPYANAEKVTLELGRLLGRQEAAEQLIRETARAVASLRSRLAGGATRPLLMAYFIDEQHVRLFCAGSIYHDVLQRAGLSNASPYQGSLWGSVQVSLDALVGLGDAAVLLIEPVPEAIRMKLAEPGRAGLIGQMPVFRDGAYRIVPPVWAYGGLPSARRFAQTLAGVLDFIEAGHDR